MALALLIGLIAGAGTALSPCVLPVLPVVLGAGMTGGRRRPLGIVAGLVISFTFAIVALVYVIDALGLPNDLLRWVAIVVLGAFGVALFIPVISDRIEAAVSRIAPGPAKVRGDGFGAGFVLGLSLGFVYAPCAGPILAGVITVSASQDFSAGRLAIAGAYALGTGLVLYALMIGGRRLTDRLKPVQGQVQRVIGAVMIVFAIFMSFDLDTRFQTAIASHWPDFLTNPTKGIEDNDTVNSRLASFHSHHKSIVVSPQPQDLGALDREADLQSYGPAPEFTNPGMWFNTDGASPTMQSLRGRVVLVDFWTYTCINCIRTLPRVESLYEDYEKDGLTVVGVHTPEFPFEHDSGNVAQAVRDNHLTYPVVQDNDYGTWDAYGNQYWPAEYLIDADGNVRYYHFGEGGEEETEQAIRTLLRDRGDSQLAGPATGHAMPVPAGQQTPETYLGPPRAAGFANGKITAGNQDFGLESHDLKTNQFAYGGNWDIGAGDGGEPGDATAGAGATLDVQFRAQHVYLVMGSTDRPRRLGVMLDGKPVSKADAGADVHNGTATIHDQRLYRLVDLPAKGVHRLTLSFDSGIKGYAFTFG
jgi:cytochrome c biogenesis protein CcdA/thiol-disulfide isomerase/thioredoxin